MQLLYLSHSCFTTCSRLAENMLLVYIQEYNKNRVATHNSLQVGQNWGSSLVKGVFSEG